MYELFEKQCTNTRCRLGWKPTASRTMHDQLMLEDDTYLHLMVAKNRVRDALWGLREWRIKFKCMDCGLTDDTLQNAHAVIGRLALILLATGGLSTTTETIADRE